MAKINTRPTDHRIDTSATLAGGYGPHAAKQDAEGQLRRCVMASLLWEDLAYETGETNATRIKRLIPQVAPEKVAQIAVEAREKQKLRHVPLLILCEMARLPEHKQFVAECIPRICTRADMLTDLVALYWKENPNKPLSAQMKRGLAQAITRFNEYALAKYDRSGTVRLRDILFLTHAKPKDAEQEALWKRLVENRLEVPDTWEVSLSTGKDKKETWERLIRERKIGGLAFLRNLRNMKAANVDYAVIQKGFETLQGQWLLPLNFLAAQSAAPDYTREIESAMLACYSQMPKLPGWTVFVLDTSGSMNTGLSRQGEFNRMSVGVALMMLAAERAERVTCVLTAGDDMTRKHSSKVIAPVRGFGLANQVDSHQNSLGRGGIFTRQMLEWLKKEIKGQPDRIIVFSDSQDCDFPGSGVPVPFGQKNYIVDVSAHSRGINYQGAWSAEISGFSEHFINFISASEGLDAYEVDEINQ